MQRSNYRLCLCPFHLANLGNRTGLFPDCEASTEHLSPRVLFRGRVSGQSDWTQSDQIRVSEMDKGRERHDNLW